MYFTFLPIRVSYLSGLCFLPCSQWSFVGFVLHVGSIRDQGALSAHGFIVLEVPLSEAPLAGNVNLKYTINIWKIFSWHMFMDNGDYLLVDNYANGHIHQHILHKKITINI